MWMEVLKRPILVLDLSCQTDKNIITDDHFGELITCMYAIYGNMPI